MLGFNKVSILCMFRLHRVEFLISCIERRGEIKILGGEFDFEIKGLFAKCFFF